MVFKECREHVEHLPDAVASLQATAALDAASQAWIPGKLGQTHYGAYIHQASFTLIPGLGPGRAVVMAVAPAQRPAGVAKSLCRSGHV